MLLGLEVLQVVVGITQSRLGLPEVLVGIHMVLAACTVAAATWAILSLRSPGDESRTSSAPHHDLASEVRN